MQENLLLYFHPKMLSIFICLLWRYEMDSDETVLSHWTGSFCCRCAAEAALGTVLSLSLAVKLSCLPPPVPPEPPAPGTSRAACGRAGPHRPLLVRPQHRTAPAAAAGRESGKYGGEKTNLFLSLQSVIIYK